MWNNVFRRSAEQNSKHPPKTSNQELRKTASQLPRPSFAPSVCEYAIRSIMISFHYN